MQVIKGSLYHISGIYDVVSYQFTKLSVTDSMWMSLVKSQTSDVVETVTSETETWLKFRDRDFVIKAETETWKFETETRDLTFL